MDANGLLELAQRYEENKDFITNEEAAKMALVVPFIKLLGYDPNSPREVRPEYSADFTQGDGKRFADRMDFAIFDKSGTKPHMVIETKPLSTDLRSKAQQLARYIAQMADLHFGIITDGCHYLFYGDLENPNQMDPEPFFRFSLDDPKTDWVKVAKFLAKFGRETFNADTLVTDAENSRYRQEMIEKLAAALRAPAGDEEFLKWLTSGVYKGVRTSAVMARLGEVAKEAVEPALLKVMGNDFVEKLRSRILLAGAGEQEADEEAEDTPSAELPEDGDCGAGEERGGIVTTEEELGFYEQVKQICVGCGRDPEEVVPKDTLNYFNVSYRRPTKWFVRLFTGGRRRNIVTWVPVDEARTLCPDFEVEAAPPVFGVSRIYIDNVAQVWALKALIQRSLEIMESPRGEGPQPEDGNGEAPGNDDPATA